MLSSVTRCPLIVMADVVVEMITDPIANDAHIDTATAEIIAFEE